MAVAVEIARMKAKHPNFEVITLEEAHERGLTEVFQYKAPPPLDICTEVMLKDDFLAYRPSNRNMRREANRKRKKRNG